MTLPGEQGPLGRELVRSMELARIAGVEVVRLRTIGLTVDMKPGDEPVTVADRRANERIVSTRLPGIPKLVKSALATHSGVTDPQRSTSRRISVPAAATVTCWPRIVRTHSSNGDHAPSGRIPGTLAIRRLSCGERRRCRCTICAS